MFTDLLVIDDFFVNPDEIVSYAKKLQYYKKENFPETLKYIKDNPGFTTRNNRFIGMRSENIMDIDSNFGKSLCDIILDKCININMGKDLKYSFEYESSLYFSWVTDSEWKHVLSDSNSLIYHVDNGSVFACVIYLSKNPDPDTGTKIRMYNEERLVENRYNRFVMYKSSLTHSPAGGFGETIDDARMALIVFIKKLNINAKKCVIDHNFK